MMKNNTQLVGLYTIIHRELNRMIRIAGQVFLPPVITTALYFLIFGKVIGDRMGDVHSDSYVTFIAPGLIMMTVITNAYANVCTSLFNIRFQRSIEEILVSPLRPSILLLGYVSGGVLRGFIVATLVFFVASLFIPFHLHSITLTLLVVILVATLFALAGFINGMLARTFDEISFIPTFILTPLTYLGGVFYSASMLPPFWKHLTSLDPIYYMVNALRHAMIGQDEVNITTAMVVILGLLLVLMSTSLILLKKGIGLRQ